MSLFSFGTSTPQGTSTNTGTSTSGLFGQSQPQQQQPAQSTQSSFQLQTTMSAPTQSSSTSVASLATHPFQYIQQCFDSNHVNYRFRAFFYNTAADLTEQQRRSLQDNKPPLVSEALWAQVQNDNPDSSRMVPVMANGFGDLHSRAQWQDQNLRLHEQKLTELHERTSKLLRDLDVDTAGKLRAAMHRHQSLSLRLIKIMKGMEVLRKSGQKLTASEAEALTRLKEALVKLTTGSLESANLQTTAFQLSALLESGRLDTFRSACQVKPANEESLAALHSLLVDQQTTLNSTIEAIAKDAADLQVIKAGYRPL